MEKGSEGIADGVLCASCRRPLPGRKTESGSTCDGCAVDWEVWEGAAPPGSREIASGGRSTTQGRC